MGSPTIKIWVVSCTKTGDINGAYLEEPHADLRIKNLIQMSPMKKSHWIKTQVYLQ